MGKKNKLSKREIRVDLPHEILRLMIEYLDLNDQFSFSLVHKDWRNFFLSTKFAIPILLSREITSLRSEGEYALGTMQILNSFHQVVSMYAEHQSKLFLEQKLILSAHVC